MSVCNLVLLERVNAIYSLCDVTHSDCLFYRALFIVQAVLLIIQYALPHRIDDSV